VGYRVGVDIGGTFYGLREVGGLEVVLHKN